MIDNHDMDIILTLSKNALISHEQLAIQTQMSTSTIRRRLQKLIDENILRFSALADPLKCELPMLVGISMGIAHEYLHEEANKLTNNPHIKWASTTTGRYDLLLLGAFKSPDELSDFMEKEISRVQGLRSLESYVCLNMLKGRYMSI